MRKITVINNFEKNFRSSSIFKKSINANNFPTERWIRKGYTLLKRIGKI